MALSDQVVATYLEEAARGHRMTVRQALSEYDGAFAGPEGGPLALSAFLDAPCVLFATGGLDSLPEGRTIVAQSAHHTDELRCHPGEHGYAVFMPTEVWANQAWRQHRGMTESSVVAMGSVFFWIVLAPEEVVMVQAALTGESPQSPEVLEAVRGGLSDYPLGSLVPDAQVEEIPMNRLSPIPGPQAETPVGPDVLRALRQGASLGTLAPEA